MIPSAPGADRRRLPGAKVIRLVSTSVGGRRREHRDYLVADGLQHRPLVAASLEVSGP
ncbi:MAG: hypothetical protein MZU97_07110 [Bacillus subtilis]|nr:hypothetical protein [Bacillus subtilis]